MSDCEPRAWVCKQCGYVLGFIMRGNDRRVKLSVLHNTCHPDMLTLIGNPRELNFKVWDMEQGTVLCGFCGASRTWHMSEQAMDDLIGRRRDRTFGLEEVERG